MSANLYRRKSDTITFEDRVFTIRELTLDSREEFEQVFYEHVSVNTVSLPLDSPNWDDLNQRRKESRNRFIRVLLSAPGLSDEDIKEFTDEFIEAAMDMFAILNATTMKNVGEKMLRLAEALQSAVAPSPLTKPSDSLPLTVSEEGVRFKSFVSSLSDR